MANQNHLNASAFPNLNTRDANNIRITYRAEISAGYRTWLTVRSILNLCSGLLCGGKEDILQRTYVQVHENRIESNYPTYWSCCGCCCGEWYDHVYVAYFDSRFGERASRAGICMPLCTHFQPCPTCFDMCGEGVVVHQDELLGRCCHWSIYPCLAPGQADALIAAFESARQVSPAVVAASVQMQPVDTNKM